MTNCWWTIDGVDGSLGPGPHETVVGLGEGDFAIVDSTLIPNDDLDVHAVLVFSGEQYGSSEGMRSSHVRRCPIKVLPARRRTAGMTCPHPALTGATSRPRPMASGLARRQ